MDEMNVVETGKISGVTMGILGGAGILCAVGGYCYGKFIEPKIKSKLTAAKATKESKNSEE